MGYQRRVLFYCKGLFLFLFIFILSCLGNHTLTATSSELDVAMQLLSSVSMETPGPLALDSPFLPPKERPLLLDSVTPELLPLAESRQTESNSCSCVELMDVP